MQPPNQPSKTCAGSKLGLQECSGLLYILFFFPDVADVCHTVSLRHTTHGISKAMPIHIVDDHTGESKASTTPPGLLFHSMKKEAEELKIPPIYR